MIKLSAAGDFGDTIGYLEKMQSGDVFKDLTKYGEMGVAALARSTPVDSGETARSWSARVGAAGNLYFIEWYNTHADGGPPVAILIQYGHGTGTGGYVAGRDFINPAMRPVFDKIVADVWGKVKNG